MVFIYFKGDNLGSLSQAQMNIVKNFHADRLLIDERSGKSSSLDEILMLLSDGDIVISDNIGNFGKNIRDIILVLDMITSKGASYVITDLDLDSSQQEANMTVRFISQLVEQDLAYKKEKTKQGIEKAKDSGKYAGRKPIAVDETLFEDIFSRWKRGEITAKTAMSELKLKPNTFYRRVKERNTVMKNQEEILKAAKELGKELKKGVEYNLDDLKELVEDVKKDYKDGTLAEKLGKEYSDKKEVFEYYYDNAKDDVKRELKEIKEYIDLKAEVNKETREYKNK